MFSFAITLSVSKPFDTSLLVYLLVKEIVMYYDFEDHATSRRRKWLQKIQSKMHRQEIRGKLILMFAFGFGVGFACCTVLVSIIDKARGIL